MKTKPKLKEINIGIGLEIKNKYSLIEIINPAAFAVFFHPLFVLIIVPFIAAYPKRFANGAWQHFGSWGITIRKKN
jgi:hypothetical protein